VLSYILCITGASGAVYGIRLLEELLSRGLRVELMLSPTAHIILGHELAMKVISDDNGNITIREEGTDGKVIKSPCLRYIPCDDLTAPLASGSSLKRTMIICPCSMGTLGRIAAGVSGNLIERAADCVLKERGRLVLVPRETPLHTIHLENMLTLARAGAYILPAMPGFYHNPRTMDDLVAFVVGKVLDALELENELFKRWGDEGE